LSVLERNDGPRRFGGLWRHADFLKLWAGETISVFGTLITRTALPFTAIIVLDASPAQMGLLTAAELGPGFLVGLVAGVWVDRLRRRPVMILTDVLRALALVTIPAAALLEVLRIGQLYAVAFTVGALSAFFDIAYRAYLPSLIEREQLLDGNSKLTASAAVAEVTSFGIGGVLVQVLTAPLAILADALSFLVSALCIARIKTPEPPPAPLSERINLLREAQEGLRLVWENGVLRALTLSATISSLAGGMISSTILLFVNRELGFSPGVLGLIFGVGGATSLLGALFAARAGRIVGLGPALIISRFVAGIGTLFIPLAGGATFGGGALLVANQLVTDPAATVYAIHELSLRQAITPDRLQGRMNATVEVARFGALLAGALLGGFLGELIGVRATLYLAAACSLPATVVLLLSPVRRYHAVEAPLIGTP